MLPEDKSTIFNTYFQPDGLKWLDSYKDKFDPEEFTMVHRSDDPPHLHTTRSRCHTYTEKPLTFRSLPSAHRRRPWTR